MREFADGIRFYKWQKKTGAFGNEQGEGSGHHVLAGSLSSATLAGVVGRKRLSIFFCVKFAVEVSIFSSFPAAADQNLLIRDKFCIDRAGRCRKLFSSKFVRSQKSANHCATQKKQH